MHSYIAADSQLMSATVSSRHALNGFCLCRKEQAGPEYAPIPPSPHPTYDLDAVRLAKLCHFSITSSQHSAAALEPDFIVFFRRS